MQRVILDSFSQPVVDLFEDLVKVVTIFPPWVVFLKPTHVADPPDMVADSAGIIIAPVQFFPRNLFAQSNGFQHGTIAEPTASHVIHLGHAGTLIEMVQAIHEIVGMDVIPHLLSLVSDDVVGFAFHGANHDIR